jgi:transcriptional regulator with XRE-family HTH domain
MVNHPLPEERTSLAWARKQRGWTQAYVATQVGVSVGAVRRWESGRLPYPTSIQKLCRLFAMSPQELGLFKDPTQSSTKTREPDDAEKQAAWEIYIELVTRVPVANLENDRGILREVLSSLYSLFQTTRTILRDLGPVKARPDGEANWYVPYLGVSMLNTTLRPLLSKWHPLLQDYEEKRPGSVGVLEYERQWENYAELRQEIGGLRKALLDYANALAEIAGMPLLVSDTPGA